MGLVDDAFKPLGRSSWWLWECVGWGSGGLRSRCESVKAQVKEDKKTSVLLC